MQVSVTVFNVREKRKEWKENIKPDMAKNLVFLDESGVNTDMTRLYGGAASSQRAVDHAPLNRPKTTTVLSSIRLDGEMAFTTYQGGTTGERFVQYLKEVLLPTLRPGDIVVMDNMRSHHVKAVRENNARCGSIWPRMKCALFYDRFKLEYLTVQKLKTLIWRYFMSYWNSRRICSANAGLPRALERTLFYGLVATA